jgi:aldose sugar dehydrogenase
MRTLWTIGPQVDEPVTATQTFRMKNVLLIAALFGCAGSHAAPNDPSCLYVENGYGPRGSVAIRAETVASGLEVPWGIAFLPNGDMLVTERPGRIRLIRGGKLLPDPVARVTAAARSEGGLLGIALHPDFANNRQFYLYYSYTFEAEGGTANKIERWTLSPEGTRAAADRTIVDEIPAARFHDGGRLRIGPDGKLYAGTGDSTSPDRAQDLDSLAGKILRVELDGGVPKDNPWPGKLAWVKGVRNVEGFDWIDRNTIVVADHGPSGELGRRGHDEVSLARAGQNLGWPTIYGCEAGTQMVSPLIAWKNAAPPGGAAVYTGTAIPEWKGNILVATLASRHLHRLVLDADQKRVITHEMYLPGDYGRLRDAIMGPDGQLYLTTSNCDGRGTCPPDKDKILRVTR